MVDRAPSRDHKLPDVRGMTSRSAPVLPPLRPHGKHTGKGIYEVTSGAVVLRAEPDPYLPGLGAIRGGVRFLATPYKQGMHTWLKVQTEGVTAPLWSPKGLGRPQEELKGRKKDMKGQIVYKPEPGLSYNQAGLAKGLSLYLQSAPKTVYNITGDAHLNAAELWIKFEESSVVRIRAKFPDLDAPLGSDTEEAPPATLKGWRSKYRLRSDTGSVRSGIEEESEEYVLNEDGALVMVSRASVPTAEDAQYTPRTAANIRKLEEELKAQQKEIEYLSTAPPETSYQGSGSLSKIFDHGYTAAERRKQWATCGPGGFVNFGKYGPHGGPPNMNCGKWRQFGVGTMTKSLAPLSAGITWDPVRADR